MRVGSDPEEFQFFVFEAEVGEQLLELELNLLRAFGDLLCITLRLEHRIELEFALRCCPLQRILMNVMAVICLAS